MPTKLFLLAGEASGDLHGANLARALRELDPAISLVGMGGPRMAAAGAALAKDLEGMQVVGFYEVLRNIRFFRRVFHELLERMAAEKPDAVVCIDYPGFNLRFAAEAKRRGVPVFYYIVPQVWAWHASRAKTMARVVDRAFAIFEFEVPILERAGVRVEYVGHPLLDCLDGGPDREEARRKVFDQVRENGVETGESSKLVAMMPGSRPGEIARHIGPLLDAAARVGREIPGTAFAVSEVRRPGSAELPSGLCEAPTGAAEAGTGERTPAGGIRARRCANTPIFFVPSERLPVYALARAADFAVVASGTATLETALAGCPMAVVYRGGWISYAIAHLLVDLPVISLANIVLGRYVFPELIQGECNAGRIAAEVARGLKDGKWREAQQMALKELPKLLGGPGAARRAAAGMLKALKG
ncbi:MAG: lipid-A-disaccharide synthase [Planctomycetota bacterium]|nr:lipid-A-disaccharide synthase [Planctomycetota bacterium]